jgi:polyisoprenoid-binding protein YceI
MFKNISFPAGIAALLLASVLAASAQSRYGAQPKDNSILLDGTSNEHSWEMAGTIIGGYLEFGPDVKIDPSAPALPDKVSANARVIIPIRAIHSKADHLPDVMEHLMQNAMKADQFPRIEFILSELTAKGPHTAGKPWDFQATGELAISGVTNKASFPVSIDFVDAGQIKVTGTATVKMTDYGIDPPKPSFGLGLMVCGNEVTIKFAWILQKVVAK